MVRLAAVFAFASAVRGARIKTDEAAEDAHALAESIAEEESLEADEGQWTCPIGRRVVDPFGHNREDPFAPVCVMVLGTQGSRCTIQDDDGHTDDRHPMHLREDDRCPQPTTTTTTTTTMEPSLVIADGCPTSQGRQRAEMQPAITGAASVRCCSLDGARCETQTVGCVTEASFFEANAVCHRHGLRLCTRQELDGGVCCGSGCGYDGHKVWTLTPELFPNPAILRNAGSGRRIYAQDNNNGASGIGATNEGEVHADQEWVIEHGGNGRYTITNSLSGRILFWSRDMEGGVGARIGDAHPEMMWTIEPAEVDGTYTIAHHRLSGSQRLFARSDGSWDGGFGAADGDRVWPDQTWYIDPVQ